MKKQLNLLLLLHHLLLPKKNLVKILLLLNLLLVNWHRLNILLYFGLLTSNMNLIFIHGSTTKKTGHGFGLHSGALAAKEMGGVLRAESPGPGRGATFVLELPLKPPGNTHG